MKLFKKKNGIMQAGRTILAIGAAASGAKIRRKTKVGPVNFNISRKGISPTIGPKGCNINFNKTGTYLNLGIPGTGIYDRIKLDKKEKLEFKPLTEEETNLELFADYLKEYPKKDWNNEEKINIWWQNRIKELLNGKVFVLSNGIHITSYYNKPEHITQFEYRCPHPGCGEIITPDGNEKMLGCCLFFFLFPFCFLFLLLPSKFKCNQCGRTYKKEELLVRYYGD